MKSLKEEVEHQIEQLQWDLTDCIPILIKPKQEELALFKRILDNLKSNE